VEPAGNTFVAGFFSFCPGSLSCQMSVFHQKLASKKTGPFSFAPESEAVVATGFAASAMP
jgi:hypothetical protein